MCVIPNTGVERPHQQTCIGGRASHGRDMTSLLSPAAAAAAGLRDLARGLSRKALRLLITLLYPQREE